MKGQCSSYAGMITLRKSSGQNFGTKDLEIRKIHTCSLVHKLMEPREKYLLGKNNSGNASAPQLGPRVKLHVRSLAQPRSLSSWVLNGLRFRNRVVAAVWG